MNVRIRKRIRIFVRNTNIRMFEYSFPSLVKCIHFNNYIENGVSGSLMVQHYKELSRKSCYKLCYEEVVKSMTTAGLRRTKLVFFLRYSQGNTREKH